MSNTDTEKPNENRDKNGDRAEKADDALKPYLEPEEVANRILSDDPGSWRDALIDLLSDLRHFARRENIDFDKAAEMAEIHFNTEVDEELEDDEADSPCPTCGLRSRIDDRIRGRTDQR